LKKNNLSLLYKALEDLDYRSNFIIKERFLNKRKANLKELAETFNISIERVRQIEVSAFKKIKSYFFKADTSNYCLT